VQGQRAVRYDIAFIIETARTRPAKLGRPFTCWSVRKLADHLATRSERKIRIGRERLRQLLHAHGVTFQRTRTWKTSNDPDFEVKLDRIEQVTARFPDRCFAFDQFGPLSIRPCHGADWAERGRPDRLPGTYRRTHGVPYFHGCYSLGDDPLWGVTRRRKSGANTLAALKSIRAAHTDHARNVAEVSLSVATSRQPHSPRPRRSPSPIARPGSLSGRGTRWGGRAGFSGLPLGNE
jgi:hypothetical protein